MHRTKLAWTALLTLFVPGATAFAQAPSGTVQVKVLADSAPLAQALVRSGRTGVWTSPTGIARLVLPTGPQRVIVARVGFVPDTVDVTIAANATSEIEVTLEAASAELEELTVSTTRTERRIEDEPIRVEVLSGEDVAEKTQMRPSDLTKLLTEMVGVRMQGGGGPLGPTQLRIQGLSGQYTGLLADGLPLFGGQPGSFGVMQLAPLDLKQAEVIKGAATALYGPSALGGLLNLVSRPAERNALDIAINQSGERGSDLLAWGSTRASATTGLTLSGDLHHQGERDLDGDRWSDVAEFTRGSVRPRLFVTWPSGDQLFATTGLMHESREGGYAAGSPENYRERLATTRWDWGLSATRALAGAGRLTGRFAGVHRDADHDFGDVPERNRETTFYGELNYAWGRPHVSFVSGAAWQHNDFTALDVSGFDYTYSVPALFAQATVDPAEWLSLSLSGRCDFHNVYGTHCSPRAALLLKPSEEWTARVSGGGGFFAPTPLTEDTEPLGLHALVPASLEIERARNLSFDLSWKHGPLELSGTLAASRLHDRVDLVPVRNDPLERLQLVNVTAGPSDIVAGELFGVYEAKPIVVTAFYGYLHATEVDAAGPGRHETALTPRTSLGIDVTWEAPETTGTWIAVEAFYTGTQTLDDNPYRTKSEDYTVMEVLISQRIGHVRLYLNGENLLDARQTRHDPLTLPQPGLGGRRTVKPWAPLQGRVISVGALIGW